jgi:STE24 endopeptidase
MSEPPRVLLDPQRQSRARRYATLRRRFALASWMLSAVYLGAWVVFGWGVTLGRAIGGAISNWTASIPWWAMLLMIAAAVGLPFGLLYIPMEYYSGFVLPHRFQISTQTLAGWISDMVKGGILSALIGSPLLVGLYALIRLSPDLWWFWSAVGYSVVSVVLSALAPVVLMPIFFKFRPLDQAHAELNDRLLALARRSGTRVRGIFTFDMSRRTHAANAALVGVGGTRRVILGDTLLSEFEPEEVETVLAHELGHHVHKDIPLFILVQTGINLLTFLLIATIARWAVPELGLSSLADPGGLPLVGLLAAGLATIINPFTNAFSRWRETLADRYALQLTQNRGAFVTAMTRLANQNLAEADPPGWAVLLFATHPPLGQRIRTAQVPVDGRTA